MTYEVDSTDLNNYKRIQNYKPGKANPFSSYETTKQMEKNGTTKDYLQTIVPTIHNNTKS